MGVDGQHGKGGDADGDNGYGRDGWGGDGKSQMSSEALQQLPYPPPPIAPSGWSLHKEHLM